MDTPPALGPEGEAENALVATASLAIAPLLIGRSDSASAPPLPAPFHGFTSIFFFENALSTILIKRS
jgi:hypothetical protein